MLAVDSPKVMTTAGWHKVSAASSGLPAFECGPGTGDERTRWLFENFERARYEVFAWIPAEPDATRSTVALYRFSEDSEDRRISVDQQAAAGTWHSLGIRWISPSGYLELSNQGMGSPMASALALVRQ